MASDFKNLTEKAEKLSIDPVYDTNWCDMPDDIKLECIGKMEFEERLSLRCTAKAERSLVDSQKIEFNTGRFWEDDEDLGFVVYRFNEKPLYMSSKNKNETLQLVNYMKKVGVFEKLEISIEGSVTKNEQFVSDNGLFTARKIEFDRCDTDNVVAILRKMKDGIESVKITVDSLMKYSLDETLVISHVQNVPYWHIKNYNKTDSIRKVAQMWIDKNTKIGSIFQVSIFLDMGSFEEFLEQFDDRIVSTNEKRVRIRTNNPDRHILLERGLDDFVTLDSVVQFFRMMVISAEMKESEYDDNCQEWICYMAPDIQGFFYDDPNPIDF